MPMCACVHAYASMHACARPHAMGSRLRPWLRRPHHQMPWLPVLPHVRGMGPWVPMQVLGGRAGASRVPL